MVSQRLISRLALCASFFAFGVIALGAFTRLIDAGLGCPDWPGCYGQFTVPANAAALLQFPETPLVAYKAWAEMIHRYFVGGLSVFILCIVFIIPFAKSTSAKTSHFNLVLAGGLVLLLVYQILLGKWTVTLKLLPIIVTQHLLGGFLILSVLWLIYLNNKNILLPSVPSAQKLKRWGILALVILFLQIALGAWTSTNYASLSCPDFPFCLNEQSMTWHFKAAFNLFTPIGINYEGGVLPETVRQTIQMMHRLGALIFTLYMFTFAVMAIRKLKEFPELMQSLYLILGLLTIQICIGISNIIFKLPLITAVSHNLVAVLLLLSLITFLFKLSRSEEKG